MSNESPKNIFDASCVINFYSLFLFTSLLIVHLRIWWKLSPHGFILVCAFTMDCCRLSITTQILIAECMK